MHNTRMLSNSLSLDPMCIHVSIPLLKAKSVRFYIANSSSGLCNFHFVATVLLLTHGSYVCK